MALHLVRHAKAGSRSEWDGDDRSRPLTKAGRRQADVLAERLAVTRPPRLLSSPFARCRETLEPLAAALATEIELLDSLGEGEPFEPLLELLATLPDESVICTHGDLIPAVIEALLRRGAELAGEPIWRKGVVWELDRTEETITRMHATPPPE